MTPGQKKALLASLSNHEPPQPDRLNELKAELHKAQQKHDCVRCRTLARLIDAELLRLKGQS